VVTNNPERRGQRGFENVDSPMPETLGNAARRRDDPSGDSGRRRTDVIYSQRYDRVGNAGQIQDIGPQPVEPPGPERGEVHGSIDVKPISADARIDGRQRQMPAQQSSREEVGPTRVPGAGGSRQVSPVSGGDRIAKGSDCTGSTGREHVDPVHERDQAGGSEGSSRGVEHTGPGSYVRHGVVL
jgi:hypothetical protein